MNDLMATNKVREHKLIAGKYWYNKAAEILTGKQPIILMMMEDFCEQDLEEMTVKEILDFISNKDNQEYLEEFWL